MSVQAGQPIRVVLIDDSPIIRLGLRSALEDYPDLAIIGEFGTAADGIRHSAILRPDVVLLDLHLPDKSGLDVCRELRRLEPPPRVLVLTSDGNPAQVAGALQAGATGYLLKENDGATLASALRRAAGGQPVMDAALEAGARSVLLSATPPANLARQKLDLLSQQERKVVALLAEGLTNREIGAQLGLTEKTVKNYLAAIFTKLDIERRTQAAALHVAATQQPQNAF